MQKKILFLDLDGTLLNDQHEISAGNLDALNRALAAGHQVVVTTGRPLISGLEQGKRLGLDRDGCYLIAYNGGIIYDYNTRKSIFERTIPTDRAIAIIRLCRTLGIYAQSYADDAVVVEPDCDNTTLRDYCDRILMPFRVISCYDTDLTSPPPKVLAIGTRDTLEKLREKLSVFDETVDYFFSTESLLEIVPKGVSKGEAVKWMCEKTGIPRENAIAVGDEQNDMSMIVAAGVGVAMANGIPSVKAAADYITLHDNNHDGVAEVIEKFMLS